MTEEQNAAIEAEREAFKAMQDAQAVITGRFADVRDRAGGNPTDEEIELAEATRATWERAKAHVEELRERM
jgi:hypothetical protein